MSTKQTAVWISLSDMMTGLMLIFLLICVLTISKITKENNEREQLFLEFDLTKEEIYHDLEKAFGSKREEWGVEITPDLSIKFKNPDVLFGYLSKDVSPKFNTILSEFIPKYIGIINNEKYKDKIKEVRIEGHTAGWDDYMFTVELSQQRANAVLSRILRDEYFSSLSPEAQDKVRFWFTANGLGNGRTLDADGKFTFYSKNEISADSRRVEFRIVTTSDELIEEVINSIRSN